MLSNIFQALESLGLTAQKRAIHIQFSNQNLNTQVFLQRIDGQHQLNAGFKAELICLSTNAAIPLKQFIGSQVAIDTVTDQGQLTRVTGIITQALQGQSDGSLTLYKLTLEDPTALWKQRRNSRVFMNKSVRDVVEVIFKEWQSKSPLFASSLTLDFSGLSQDYDVRPFIMQSNESDYDFLTRLMRSEGINWLIDEAERTVALSSATIQPQKLRLIDDNSQYQALDRRQIRYHRSSATEQYDSMTSLIGQRTLQPSSVHVQRWQADALEQEEGAGSVQSTHKHSEQYDNASLGLEQAWHFSPAWMQDLNGEDGATQSGNAQIEKFNQNLGQYYDLQSKQFVAHTTVRDTHVGYWFELAEHPEIDQHSGADKEFLITGKNFYNQNNLPKDLNQQINQLLAQSNWQPTQYNNAEERQANQLTLQRRNIKTVPEYHPLQHRPAASPQRAKVVGPSGEEIHVDEWGRIKVRFLFTRNDDHSHDGGAGANDNDTDSAWVDVLTPWAGEGYGARFLPRIDEIVVIDFFDGNIDRPFVVGRIHEAHRSPTKFDNSGKLPDTKKLAGIKSKEYQGEGYNQLRFDDTTGQISAQLQSSHAASQLNLGKLSHPKDKAESEDRGEGFELRTDQWGAVRAGKGLLLSTHKQDQAQGEHLDAQPAKQQLESNQSNAKALSEVAKNQQTDEIESLDQLKEFAEQIQEKIAQFKKSLLLLNSPAGIGVSTNEDIHLSADRQINQFAGDSINLSTQKNLITHAQNRISVFAAQNGIKQVAAKGKFEVQAQGDGMDLLAKQGIQIISTEGRIEITSPKEIVITAGGSQIKLDGSGIFPTTGGKFEVKAGQHMFVGGQSVSAKLPYLPKSDVKSTENKSYLIDSSTGRILANRKYRLIDPFLGTEIQGQSDSEGLIDSLKPEMLLEILPISGKKYQDSLKSLPKTIIEPQAAGKEEKGKVLKAKDLASSEQVIAAAIKKHPELKDYINKMKADGYQLDSLPIVPTGSRLIEPKRLLVMAPNTGRSSYKYLNLFAPSETTFHTTIKMMIDGKYLPSQYFYVFAHGNTSLMLGTNGRSFVDKNKNVTIMQFIERLKSEGYSEEQTLVLVSCNTGNGLAPIAEILSKQEGIGTVYAPTSLGWYYSTLPDVRVYARFKKSATERKAEPRLSGHMRIFNGAETIKT